MKTFTTLLLTTILFANLLGQAPFPFEEDFESGNLNLNYWSPFPNMSGIDGVIEVKDFIGINNSHGLSMGKLNDNTGFATNTLDLLIDLSGQPDVELTFWIADSFDETDEEDGLYFSDNGGDTFAKVLDFSPSEWCDNLYGQHPPIDVVQLATKAGLSIPF